MFGGQNRVRMCPFGKRAGLNEDRDATVVVLYETTGVFFYGFGVAAAAAAVLAPTTVGSPLLASGTVGCRGAPRRPAGGESRFKDSAAGFPPYPSGEPFIYPQFCCCE